MSPSSESSVCAELLKLVSRQKEKEKIQSSSRAGARKPETWNSDGDWGVDSDTPKAVSKCAGRCPANRRLRPSASLCVTLFKSLHARIKTTCMRVLMHETSPRPTIHVRLRSLTLRGLVNWTVVLGLAVELPGSLRMHLWTRRICARAVMHARQRESEGALERGDRGDDLIAWSWQARGDSSGGPNLFLSPLFPWLRVFPPPSLGRVEKLSVCLQNDVDVERTRL
ncbi:hypothetical protein TGCAST_387070 [Toxoplasma gondii CAST]|uniref:Uncharacterized protein n=1 Tax=Toxoplasma gondii CAST TaxID=943122 RepID=A0A3R8BAM2_TOXGO|nr:hypothetical protein TGCAST_387070 [Toxoplasma gondii CAST]